jgi:hypothetical protein
VSAGYKPTWLRLSEARACLMSSLSISEGEAEAWILRAIQDQLRVDAERYNAQKMFQVQGFPTQWKRRRFPRDWPARLTPDRIDWVASTILGLDPERLIDNNLFIEIRASVLPNAPADTPSGLPTETPAPWKSPTPEMIRAKIREAYSEEKTAGRRAPNINDIPKLVRPKLNADGYDAAYNRIKTIADEPPFKALREPTGVRAT